MAFSGGTFSRLYDWTDDRDGGIKILASRMDEEMDGFATGLSTCILKDGSQTVTANIPMGTYKFTGLGAGTGAGESVRYEQVVLLSAGANQTITRSAAGTVLTLESTDAGANEGPDLSLYRNSSTPAVSDVLGAILFDGEDSAGNQETYGRIRVSVDDPTSASEDGRLRFGVVTAGTFADELALIGSALHPNADDGLALGISGTAFSDLFLASGAVINFNAGNYTVTHSAGILTFSGVIAAASTIEVGHASDTTISRLAAGQIGVEGNAICRIKTGTYTGDGTESQSITGVGFTPKYVRIWPRTTASGTAAVEIIETTAEILDDHANGGSFMIATTGLGDASVFVSSRIIALGADGFTVDDVGGDANPNTNGAVYNYLCLG